MKEPGRYGTTVGGIEWEIDLERERMVCAENSKIVRKLNEKEVDHLRKQISKGHP